MGHAGAIDSCGNGFFFQAEDGIRDLTVTGVQTCALPICAAGHGPRQERGLHRDRVLDVAVDQRREAAKLGEREVLERLALVEGVTHEPADDLVRLAKGQALPHEVVREVGGGREVLPRGAPHSIGAERERGEERRQDADDRLERVHGGEERDRKSTRLNSSHSQISYAVFCLKQKKYSTISV